MQVIQFVKWSLVTVSLPVPHFVEEWSSAFQSGSEQGAETLHFGEHVGWLQES